MKHFTQFINDITEKSLSNDDLDDLIKRARSSAQGVSDDDEKSSDEKKRASEVLDWISENYIVPYDFDQDATFGPLARVTHEQRLMIAYNAGLLKQTDDEKDLGHKKCICCFDDTHSYRYCSARTLKFGRSSQNLAPKNA